MSESTVRFEIGFVGGGGVSGRGAADAVTALEKAVQEASSTPVELVDEGARVLVRADQVAWLRVHGRVGRVVGF